ncbi:ankyrin repeat domain containing protein [Perkinsus marinus ATCC 50983]|uniref:Ankyrin repeat domain containing protein n=1 Tax=Perkinsus marinus (strain ATCC 50983 / TXsc) TaxID=423536 RepID=C5KYM7_PERM5|nr:ankyrin repeat domain containing protein [Perkinsus marinus ATCC 50983]EER10416.1 ankyrin repeat domain containing protein [Perkinsus marinus ATCC 50983]|eukprot:XP_002778621.1 ankyrin repeat domain containing protein [Perkinsus marinus ATCC 50983]
MTFGDHHSRETHSEYNLQISPGCGPCCLRPAALGSLLAVGTPAKACYTKKAQCQSTGMKESRGPCVTPAYLRAGRVERHSSMPEVNSTPCGTLVMKHKVRGISAELFESSAVTPKTAESGLRTFPAIKTSSPSEGVLKELELEMLRAVRADDPLRVRKILASGCRANPQTCPSDSFLLESTSLEVSLLLLDAGADVNVSRSSDGDSPLMLAIRSGDTRMVRLLLQYGANPSVRNRRNESPLILAAQLNKHEIYSLLMRRLTACMDRHREL